MPQVWTKDEEVNFLKDISAGKNINEIALQYNRSPSALNLRLKKIIYENMKGGAKEESLAKLLHMDINKVKQLFYEYQGFIDKKAEQGIIPAQTASTLINKETIKTEHKNDNFSKIEAPTPPKLLNIGGNKTENKSEHKSKLNSEVNNIPQFEQDNRIKFAEKLSKIKKENKIMKELVDNSELRKKINKMIREGVLDKKIKKVIRKAISQ
jgi:hypothetical protein